MIVALTAEVALAADGAAPSWRGGGDRQPPQIIEEAAVTSLQESGVNVKVTMTSEDASLFQFRGRGRLDMTAAAGHLEGVMTSRDDAVRAGMVTTNADSVLIDASNLAEQSAEVRTALAGRTWLRMPIDTFTSFSNPVFATFTAPMLLPRTMAMLLRGAEDQRRVGKQQYRLTIDTEIAFARVPAADYRTLESYLYFLGLVQERLPARVRVDADGRIKQIVATIPLRGIGTTRVRVAYSDYGVALEPPVVPDDEVADIPTTPFPVD
jgi:hypothetical protein